MSAVTKALSIIGNTAMKSIPFQQWGMGDGISGTSTFDRTFLPTQPGAEHNYREDAGDVMQNSVVAAAVFAVGQAMGEAPPMLEKRVDDVWEPQPDHPAIHRLKNPNGFHTINHMFTALAGSEITNGEGFLRVVMNGANNPGEIWYERPDMVRIVGGKQAFIDHYELMVNGVPYALPASRDYKTGDKDVVMHFRAALNHYNPRWGWSPLQAGYRQITGDNAATTYHTALMRNVTSIGLLITLREQLENNQSVTPEQFDQIKQKILSTTAGEGAGSVAAINLPLSVTKLGMTPDEMSLDSLISYYEYRICSLIGTDPMILGLGSGTVQKTYNTFAEAIDDFWNRRIIPVKNRQAEELRIQYLPLWGLDPDEYRITWDYSNVAAMSDDRDAKSERVVQEYLAGIADLHSAATILGYETTDDMKGQRLTPSVAGDGMGDGMNDQHARRMKAELKAAPDLPESNADPFGMAFTQKEIDALTDMDSESVKAAFANSTADMKKLLSARQIDNDAV